MLSAEAYSFRQKSRLAISLSWIGGFTNIIALVACGTFASNHTGTATLVSRYVGEGEWHERRSLRICWDFFDRRYRERRDDRGRQAPWGGVQICIAAGH